jgi:acyl-CoA dehydrogenase family protein 9
MVWTAVDETIQIWGGAGYMKEFPLEKGLRDARINRIFEGTNEILRAFIALSGMQAPGEELARLGEAIKSPLKALGPVSDFAIRKVKRSVWGERMALAHPALKAYAATLEELSGELANHVEALLRKHGKDVIMAQFAQKRIADAAIDLYGMACVLARVTRAISEKDGPENCSLELAIAESYFRRAGSRVRFNFRNVDRNDDVAVKFISERACELGRYPFDSLKG